MTTQAILGLVACGLTFTGFVVLFSIVIYNIVKGT